MDDLKKDLSCLLYYFVERETDEENEFIQDQKKCELKLCLSVSHSNYASENKNVDLLKIHTKLYQSYQLLEDDVNYDQNYYYIKSQTVSHCTGIASPNNLDNRKIMSIETVVTKDNCKCETVFKTFVTKSDNGMKRKTQRSFTREISKCQHLSNENGAHNRFSVIFSDEEDGNVNTNNETTIDNPVSSVKSKPSKKPPFKKIKWNKSSKSIEKQTSIDNNKIIENDIKKLQPIKRPKPGFKKFWKNFFHRTSSVENEIKPTSQIDSNNNVSNISFMRSFSTESEEMEKEKPTNILASINLTKGTKSFEIIKDDIPFIDEDDDDEENDYDGISLNRSRSNSFNDSLIHFNFSVSDEINTAIKEIIEKMSCKCVESHTDFISDCLRLISSKQSDSAQKKMRDRIPFDQTHNHYIDCEVWLCKKIYLKYKRRLTQSQENLQISNLCSFCKDIDKHFLDNISSIFIRFLERINKQDKKDLCSCDEKKKNRITTYLIKLMNAMKANDDFKNSFNWSTKHFKDCLSNFNAPSINPMVNPMENLIDNIDENAECTCEERRLLAMRNYMNSLIDKNPKLININEINKFNNETRHYTDCSRLSSHDSSVFFSPISSKFLSSSHNSVFFSSQRGSMSNILATPGFEMSKSRESSFRGSIDHFDKTLPKLKTTEAPISCDCDKRRLESLAKFISFVVYQKSLNRKEIDELNFNSHHFKSCSRKLSSSEISPSFSFSASPYNENSPVFDSYSPQSVSKRSKRKHSVSTDSIKYLDQVLQDIKIENKIECPMETINYFIKCKNYEHYEKGLEKVLDSKPTIENMRLLFYLTRMIVRHIDDPNSGENQEIKEILEFSENFLRKYFYEEITKQNGLEKFILGINSLD